MLIFLFAVFLILWSVLPFAVAGLWTGIGGKAATAPAVLHMVDAAVLAIIGTASAYLLGHLATGAAQPVGDTYDLSGLPRYVLQLGVVSAVAALPVLLVGYHAPFAEGRVARWIFALFHLSVGPQIAFRLPQLLGQPGFGFRLSKPAMMLEIGALELGAIFFPVLALATVIALVRWLRVRKPV